MAQTKQDLKERIFFLIDFSVSEYFSKTNNPYISEYIELAFEISKKINYRMPKEIHQKVCKKCYCVRDSKNTLTRITSMKKNGSVKKYLKIHCLKCNYIKKIKLLP